MIEITVMEKNIAHPTDARLYERARRKLFVLAREAARNVSIPGSFNAQTHEKLVRSRHHDKLLAAGTKDGDGSRNSFGCLVSVFRPLGSCQSHPVGDQIALGFEVLHVHDRDLAV